MTVYRVQHTPSPIKQSPVCAVAERKTTCRHDFARGARSHHSHHDPFSERLRAMPPAPQPAAHRMSPIAWRSSLSLSLNPPVARRPLPAARRCRPRDPLVDRRRHLSRMQYSRPPKPYKALTSGLATKSNVCSIKHRFNYHGSPALLILILVEALRWILLNTPTQA